MLCAAIGCATAPAPVSTPVEPDGTIEARPGPERPPGGEGPVADRTGGSAIGRARSDAGDPERNEETGPSAPAEVPADAGRTSATPGSAGPPGPDTTSAPDPDPPTATAAAPSLPLPAPTRPARLGSLGDPGLVETSGLAAAPGDGRVLWAANDSGAEPLLHALNLRGASLGRVRIDVKARDWEDLASATLAGVPTLVVADTGDNRRRHDAVALHLVAAPDAPGLAGASAEPLPEPLLAPWATLAFRYEDGPQDVESVAHADGAFWLLSKAASREGASVPGGIYRLDASPEVLAAATDARARGREIGPLVARRVATLSPRPATLASRLALAVAGVDLNHPTALDIDEVAGIAWVLTYTDVLRFDRRGNEPWERTLARPGRRADVHGLTQAEALAVTPAGLVVFTSEGREAPLMGLPGR